MPKYTFTFKKDDIFVEFTTADKDIVERQFQIWVADADAHARRQKSRPAAEKTINDIIQNKEPEAKKETAPAPEPVVAPAVEMPKEEPAKEVAEEVPVIDKASSLLKTINTIQSEETTTQAEQEIAPAVDFESVLEQTIENPTFEPEITKDPVFLNLIKSKNTTDRFHYLIITAYYLSEFEKLERFSLKQINAKLMQNLSTVIDHQMLQEALNQNLLTLVPDLTGIAEVGEYKLTQLGEEFFATKI